MPTRPPASRKARVTLRTPRLADAPAFLAAVRGSRRLHTPWVKAPGTRAAFAAYVRRSTESGARRTHAAFLVCRTDDGSIVGVFNFSEIVRGLFNSAYVGYYALAPNAGQGLMAEGFALALDAAFGRLGLHRVEANVQPTNERSLALVERVGFTREGYSRRYVKIAGRWRDHVRFAMLAEDWRALRRGRRMRRSASR